MCHKYHVHSHLYVILEPQHFWSTYQSFIHDILNVKKCIYLLIVNIQRCEQLSGLYGNTGSPCCGGIGPRKPRGEPSPTRGPRLRPRGADKGGRVGPAGLRLRRRRLCSAAEDCGPSGAGPGAVSSCFPAARRAGGGRGEKAERPLGPGVGPTAPPSERRVVR